MKRFIQLFLLAAACMQALAIELPEGSKLLYRVERRYECYGMYWHAFTVFTQAGKTYLVREQSFSGAAEIIIDADGIARNARLVKMELSGRQVKKLCEEIKNADLIGKIRAYEDELREYENAVKEEQEAERKKSFIVKENGDTLYRVKEVVRQGLNYHMPTLWDVSAEWDGVATGVKSAGQFYSNEKAPSTWKTKGRPARMELLSSINKVNSLLDGWAYKYKLRNYDRDELFEYRYRVSGGMTAHRSKDGRILREGSCIQLEEEGGQWFVTGYIGEREDTVAVGEDVARKVEKLCNKLNIKALKPQLRSGEKLVKSEVSDSPYWEIFVGYHTKDNINTGDDKFSAIIEPKRAAKDYDKLLKDIEAINYYLWSFLSLK